MSTKKTRNSPSESATLYKIGTKKKGNDGNTWTIVENVNGVKRWKLYKKINPKTIKITDFYNIPKIKKNNWNKWFEKLSISSRKILEKFKDNIVNDIKGLGIKVELVPLPLSESGVYWIDYVWDVCKEKYPNLIDDEIPILIVVFKLDNDLHLLRENIMIQHNGIKRTLKKQLIELFEKKLGDKFKWNGKAEHTMSISS